MKNTETTRDQELAWRICEVIGFHLLTKVETKTDREGSTVWSVPLGETTVALAFAKDTKVTHQAQRMRVLEYVKYALMRTVNKELNLDEPSLRKIGHR